MVMQSTSTLEAPRQPVGTQDASVIAIVDDDESLRRSLGNFLRSVGFRVETFASAEDFLTSTRRERSECLLLDLRMTGMSGLDLLRHLAAAGIHVPAVMLTAHADAEIRQQCLEAGAAGFLEKPFHRDALLDAIRTALG
jgi:FixJ family two-component response regulator